MLAMASSPAYAASEASAKVDEIIVTATKRAQTLQEVPISLAAVTGDTLDAQAVRQFTDLQSMVPNLQIDQTNGNYAITIRGLGPGPGNLAFEQSVGLFVDGVYSSRARSLQTAFLDVERVEVVRGPQGALFGKNTNAGAISVISRAPSHDYQAEVRAATTQHRCGTQHRVVPADRQQRRQRGRAAAIVELLAHHGAKGNVPPADDGNIIDCGVGPDPEAGEGLVCRLGGGAGDQGQSP